MEICKESAVEGDCPLRFNRLLYKVNAFFAKSSRLFLSSGLFTWLLIRLFFVSLFNFSRLYIIYLSKEMLLCWRVDKRGLGYFRGFTPSDKEVPITCAYWYCML